MDSLKCSMCCGYLSIPPIKDGPPICGRCEFMSPGMPAEQKAYLADNTVPTVCPFKECNEDIPCSEMKHHISVCPNRTIMCPSNNYTCKEIFNIQDIVAHFQNYHLPDKICNNQKLSINCSSHFCFSIQLLVDKKFPYLIFSYIDMKSVRLGVCSVLNDHTANEFDISLSCNSNEIMRKNQKILPFHEQDHCIKLLKKGSSFTSLIHNVMKNEFSLEALTSILKPDSNIILKIKIHEIDAELPAAEIRTSENKHIRENFQCQICYEYMLAPIYNCARGHSLCSKCRVKIRQCPSCQFEIGFSRNFILEEISGNIRIPCQLDMKGCRYVGNISDIILHEQTCLYKICD